MRATIKNLATAVCIALAAAIAVQIIVLPDLIIWWTP